MCVHKMQIDLSSFVVPEQYRAQVPNSDPLYDETVKRSIKTVEEAKALGFHSADIICPNENIASHIETHLMRTPQVTYFRKGLSFEIRWTDVIPVVEEVPENQINLEELMMIDALMLGGF